MSYTIGELAKKFNIAPSALRYYEKEGLIPGVKRKASGAREFEAKDCEVLLLIDCLKQAGCLLKRYLTLLNSFTPEKGRWKIALIS